MRVIILFILSFIMISCEQESDTPQELILGHWTGIPLRDDLIPMLKDQKGIEFLTNNICHDKQGYFDYETYLNDTTDREKKVLRYLGTQTKYILTKDSLKIYNLSDKKWEEYKVEKLTKDSLLIRQDTIVETFFKKSYKTDAIPDFDAIIVSSSPCFGSCPVNDIYIDKSGKVIYNGSYYTLNKGFYTSNIKKEEFDDILIHFKQADYINLENSYFTMVTDSRTIYTSFIKDGKIIKSISDYAASAPNELIWAYTPLLYLAQKINLKPKDVQSFLKFDFTICSFEINDAVLQLYDSESFYLIQKLVNGKNADLNFKEKYNLMCENEYVNKITTDGRYYKFYLKDGSTKVIDIGMNFLENNSFSNSFEKPNKAI